LWWDKFFHFYNADWSVGEEAKSDWLHTLTGKRGPKNLEAFVLRQIKLGHHLKAARSVFSTNWHFVTGTGVSHPIENGFSWHPVLGVPYLGGSAVKGLLRAWIEEWKFEDENDPAKSQMMRQWFGSTEDDNEKAGDLIFFDAIPVEKVEVGPDITNPHIGKWLEQGDLIQNVDAEPEKVPADWHSPIPIHFLVVKNGSYLFQIAPRGETSPAVAQAAMTELQLALEFLGAGAKTAVGYGRMRLSEPPHAVSVLLTELNQPIQGSALESVVASEYVTMIAEPVGDTVKVRSEEKGDEFICSHLPAVEASARWQADDRVFTASVTRHEDTVLRAVVEEW